MANCRWLVVKGGWRQAAVAAALAAAMSTGAGAQEQPMKAESAGIKVLTGLTVPEFEREMQHFVQALGVNCAFCHVARNFPADDKPQKAVARRMIEMTKALNKQYFPSHVPGAEESTLGKVTCQTCHNGARRPGEKTEPPR